MSDFRVGDRVELLRDVTLLKNGVGITGTVVRVANDALLPIGVAWDTFVNGHNLGGLCANGHGWAVSECDIRLISNPEESFESGSDADFMQLLLGK